MTLRELRISKGLNQKECALYLGMSTRNYQIYENNPDKENTARYHSIFNKLERFGNVVSERRLEYGAGEYRTSVVCDEKLKALTAGVAGFNKRDCFKTLKIFTEGKYDGKVAVLYGLRRTGKTTLLFQMINELPVDKTAYILIKTTDNMSMLTKDLDILYEKGYRYVFIDEVTLMDDFIDTAALLSDLFATMGMKIVLSGTDSLGFVMASRDELYDRNIMIHTSFIPFREYSRLMGIKSVDTYIEYGGTLKTENMSFDDPDAALEEVSFRDNESTRKYIDSAISRNIQHTLKNDRNGEYFNQLRDLYDKGELTNVINRVVESMNHQFLLRTVQEEFKSHDLGSAKELLLHEYPAEVATVLYDVDEKAVVERLKAVIDIKEKSETTVKITKEHMEKIKKYLLMLDLVANCTEVYESKSRGEHMVFTQPGMRYSITKALVFSLLQDEFFNARPEKEKKHIIEKISEDVKGRMLEDIVLFETSTAAKPEEEVFKFKFDDGGEYDLVVYNQVSNTCCIYEVKHSDKASERQTRYLRDEARLSLITRRFGKISGKFVIYRGKDQKIGDIQYLNAEKYLNGLG